MKPFDLDPEEVLSLPPDELAISILRDVVENDEWNEHNWLLKAAQGGYAGRSDVLQALAEAWSWLRRKGLIAHTPGQTDSFAIFVTRPGLLVLREGIERLRASELLDVDLHSRLRQKVRPQFLMGEFELAAFSAMREVEIRVRSMIGASDSEIGVSLMRRALGSDGPLMDASLDPGEQRARMDLFAGAIGSLKNPSSHREVDFDNPLEAAEVVFLADLLMRILDRIESASERTAESTD